MSATTTIDLRTTSSWEPFDLLPPPRFEIARGEETTPLFDLVQTIAPEPITDTARLVVRSRDIDNTGRIVDGTNKAPYRGHRVDPQADESSEALRLGDVLVPSDPQAPAVLVSEELDDSIVFSSSFTAFRPVRIDPLVLWAAFSSHTGMKAREEAANRQAPNQGVRLWAHFHIDTALLQDTPALLDRLRELLPDRLVELRETAPPVSSWSHQSLGVFRTWEHAIRRVGQKDPEDGIPLSELAEVTRGRSQSRVQRDEAPSNSGRTGATHDEVLLAPGDLVIHSLRPGRQAVQIADAVRPAKSVEFRIRTRVPELTAKIARYLSSEAGEARLRERYVGVHPRLSPTELASFTIPRQVIETPLEQSEVTVILSQALEDALWMS